MSHYDIAAERLRAAYHSGPIAPLRHQPSFRDEEDGYAIQARNRDVWIAGGRELVGTKIGLTSRAVQQQLGVDEPDYGILFADMRVGADGMVPAGRLLQPRVEAEIAFVLARDIDKSLSDPAALVDAIAYALPAIEIVDSRIADWDIAMVDTIADNASSGMFALGAETVDIRECDLAGCGMRLERNGVVVSDGGGAACLGNPLHALQWLVGKRVARGEPLRAGDIILSGALGPMVPAQRGDRFTAHIAGFGSLAIAFAA